MVLQKTILIYNKNKAHIDMKRFARDTTFYKYNYSFDKIALMEDKVRVFHV